MKQIDFEAAFKAMPGTAALLDIDAPKYSILAATADFLKPSGKSENDVVGKGIFEAFPLNPEGSGKINVEALETSFQKVIQFKKEDTLPVHRYDVLEQTSDYSERYWEISINPVLSDGGEVIHIIISAKDITQKITSSQYEEKILGLQNAYELFMQAPIAIAIIKGADMQIDMANDPILHIWGKGRDVVNKKLTDVLPEFHDQGLIAIMQDVFQTGNPYFGYETPIDLVRDGHQETLYFNFFYQPFYEGGESSPAGVMIFANNISERVNAIKRIQLTEVRFQEKLLYRQALLEAHNSASLDGILIVDANAQIVTWNKRFIDIWHMPQEILDKRDDSIVLDFAQKLLKKPEDFLADVRECYANPERPRTDDLEFADGRVIERRGYPVIGENGEYFGWSWAFRDVTDHRNYEKTISENEHRFRTLIEEATVATALYLGENIEVQYANQIMLDYWGKDKSVIGKPFLDALPELKGQPFIGMLKEVYTEGKTINQYRYPATLVINGKPKLSYFNFTYKPLRDESGKIYGIHHMAIDVSEEVLLTQALKDSRQRFENLIRDATVGIVVMTGKDMVVEIANVAYGKLLNLSSEDLVGKPLFDVIPTNREKYLPLLQQVFRTGEPLFLYGTPYDFNDGSGISQGFVNAVYQPYKDVDGSIIGVMALGQDVTAQTLLTRQLEQSTEQYRDLADSLDEKVRERTFTLAQLNETFRYAEQIGNFGSYRYNYQNHELTYSENLYRILGCEPFEFPPGPEEFIKFIHPEDRDYVNKATTDAFDKREPSRWEYRLYRKDGKLIHVRGTGKLVDGDNGGKYMIGTLQDITEEKKQEEQLRENNEALTTMNKELESFAYISSHDLQEPLRKIQTFASRIIEDDYENMSESGKTYFSKIQNAALRMQTLIDDLLVYSRTSTEDRKFENINLHDIVAEITEELREDIELYQAEVWIGAMCEMRVIPFQFRQLMHNLIGNALKFSKRSERPRIEINCETVDSSVLGNEKAFTFEKYHHISVSDNGIGFEPEYGERIFQVFQRLHTKDKYSGTGIGLAIVKKIIENHEGVIKATGQAGKGATFDIYIPASPVI